MYGNCSNALYARDKKRLSLAVCWAGLAVAAPLPPRGRAALGYLYSALLNPPLAALSVGGAWLSERLSSVLIFLLYWAVLGPCALAQRLSGRDWLGLRPGPGGRFTARLADEDNSDDLRRPY
ncbi:MAG: hypothetical protein A2X37_05230 [Elusimicrobia bacterium GWA2_66_18]|nr:MAG: hypothetical protein A2X37_05230 [Elusimicrobia bacterium GWA2_66_18]